MHRKIFLRVSLLLALPLQIFGYAHNSEAHINSAVMLYDLTDAKQVYQFNSNSPFIAASIQKLATAYAALNTLGKDYQFSTDLKYQGQISNKKLDGNIIFKFSGDPSLRSTDITKLIISLKTHNIKYIGGNVILDTSDFDLQNYGPGWMWDELDDCYAAPISAAILDGNCVSALISPSDKQLATVSLQDKLYLPINNNIVNAGQNDIPVDIKMITGNDKSYNMTGSIGKNTKAQELKIAVRNPNQITANKIQRILKENNITVAGTVLFATQQAGTLIARHKSPKLEQIITKMLQQSDNLIAEALFKKVGQSYANASGSWQNGHEAVLEAINKPEEYIKNTQLKDGSGLSRYNYLSAQQIIKLLRQIYQEKADIKIIQGMLAKPSKSGTLAWLAEQKPTIELQAKTGSMSGVYNLAGFFKLNKHKYAFAILLAGNDANKNNMQHLAANILTKVVKIAKDHEKQTQAL